MTSSARPWLAAAASCLLASNAHADFTIMVANTNDDGAGSLRAAIVAAHAQPHETVLIYFSTSSFPQNGIIQLQSALPLLSKTRVFISGQGRQPRLRPPPGSMTGLLNGSAALQTLSLTGLRLEGGRSNSSGACVSVGRSNVNDPPMQVAIIESEFSDCHAIADTAARTAGGAVVVKNPGAYMTVRDSVFSNSRVANGATGSAHGGGGAIEFLGAYLTIESSRFFNNRAEMVQTNGGALNTGGSLKRLVVRDSVFAGNRVASESAIAYGGAIQASCFQDCEAFVERNYYSDNVATIGGAVYLRRGNVGDRILAYVSNNTFHANRAGDSGGALALSDAVLELTFNTFEGNAAPAGAHVRIGSAEPAMVEHNALGASSGGPACEIAGTTATASRSAFNAFVDPGCIPKLQPGAAPLPTLGTYALNVDEPMPVIAYAIDGPLIDAGASGQACFDLDARQTLRPLDGNGDGDARCDIGAYERPAPPPRQIFADGFET